MNDNAKALVETLRGGEYKQAVRALRVDDGYCCLGVASDLFIKATGRGSWEHQPVDGYDGYHFVLDGRHEGGALHPEVAEWFGINDESGGYTVGAVTHSLAGRNDAGATFEQIADIIESEPQGLFA